MLTTEQDQSSPESLTLSVCVLTCNRNPLLQRLLSALLPQLGAFDEIVILDTGANASTQQLVEAFTSPLIRYVAHALVPFDFATARNLLLDQAQKQAVAFIDDDAIPLSNWIEEIRNGLLRHGAVGGATLAQGGMPGWWDTGINWCIGLSPPGTILGKPGFYPDTCNMAAHRELWDRFRFTTVTGEKRELYATGREDADWWMQRRINGYDVAVNYRQAVTHFVHPDRISRKYIYRRAYNDGVASWTRRPSYKGATEIPWDIAHIAGVVLDKLVTRPFDRRYRLADFTWFRRQLGRFIAVWKSPLSERPRHREQVRQLLRAALFQIRIRCGKAAFSVQRSLQIRGTFPPDSPDRIFVSADCFVGDSVLLREHIFALANTFPNARILVSCRYPVLFTQLPANILVMPTADATKAVQSKKFLPVCAIVPYFPFGDEKLWRKRLAPIGVTFDCDVGFTGRRDYILARKQVPKSMELHEHENLARLFSLWPLTRNHIAPPPAVPDEAMAELDHKLKQSGITGQFITIQLGSGHASKDWPAADWEKLISRIQPAINLPVILIGGSDWHEAAAQISAACNGSPDAGQSHVSAGVLNLCGSSLKVLMAAISRSALAVGGCSGPKHLAVAYRVPTFTLYAASEPIRWGAARDHDLHGYVNALPQKLSGLELQELPEDYRVKLLDPENVAEAVLKHWEMVKHYHSGFYTSSENSG